MFEIFLVSVWIAAEIAVIAICRANRKRYIP